MKKIGKSKK